MMNSTLALLALRNRLLGTTVCTTGSLSLEATATGYVRTTGSFVTDGFAKGQEFTPAGFPANPVDVVTDVTALTITTANTHATATAASGRSLTVGIPEKRGFENVSVEPTAGRPYVEEDFIPGPHRVVSIPAATGRSEESGLYVVRWFGLSNTGVAGIRRAADAILARFTPGTAFVLSDGTTLRIPMDPAPRAGQITPLAGGWSYVTLDIPFLGESINAVAA